MSTALRNCIDLARQHLNALEAVAQQVDQHVTSPIYLPPRIGSLWLGQGGHYAGMMAGRDGGDDYYLIVGPELGDELTWNMSVKKAKALNIEGHTDFDLPYRNEQAVMFGNVGTLFQRVAYWSCEQHASHSDYAYYQNFNNGDQDYWGKGNECRARAVRRLPIQSFNHFPTPTSEKAAA